MQTGMMLLVAACIGLAFASASVIPVLADGLTTLAGFAPEAGVTVSGSTLSTAGLAGSMSPLILGATLVFLVALTPLVLRLIGVRSERRVAENWGCGRAVQSPRMEYTATSFAEPLQRVFDDIYRPDTDLQVSHHAESSYFVQAVEYRVGIVDVFEKRLYQPAVRLAIWWGDKARWIQNGSIHRYLSYSLAALIIVLVISR